MGASRSQGDASEIVEDEPRVGKTLLKCLKIGKNANSCQFAALSGREVVDTISHF